MKLNLPIVILLFFYSSTFFSTSDQKGANDHISNSLAIFCGIKRTPSVESVDKH